jgi:ribosomal protein S18 acetylase RimI-like enzyme
VFPDYFLAHMGQRFLECFYGEFADQSGNYGGVALVGHQLVGAVLGTIDSGAFYSEFYRRHFGPAACAFLRGLVTDPYIRQNAMARTAHVRSALRSLAHRRRRLATPEMPPPASVPARLLSIGVDPDFRGRGIAQLLVDFYCEQLRRDGIAAVGLSVRPDNQRAIAFYQKSGWQQGTATVTSIHFSRSTQPQTGPGGP